MKRGKRMKQTIEKCNVCDSYTNPKDCEACDGTGKVELNTISPMVIIEGKKEEE